MGMAAEVMERVRRQRSQPQQSRRPYKILVQAAPPRLVWGDYEIYLHSTDIRTQFHRDDGVGRGALVPSEIPPR